MASSLGYGGYGAAPALIRSELGYGAPALLKSELGYGVAAPALAVRSFEQIPILRESYDDDNYGTYNLAFETGNGISTREIGQLHHGGLEGPVNVKAGSYSYISPEGIPITTSWEADEFGFHARGAHLPVPPVDINHHSLGLACADCPGGPSTLRFASAPVAFAGYGAHAPALLLKSGYGF